MSGPIVTGEPLCVPGRCAGWKEIVRRAVRDVAELGHRLALPAAAVEEAARVAAETGFSVFVPEPYLARMKPGSLEDPLLRQVWPQRAESSEVVESGEAGKLLRADPDPLREAEAVRAPRLLQKYAGRALLLVGRSCPVHCRFCFRRDFVAGTRSPDGLPALASLTPAIERLARSPDIHEVILSGGDPLMLTDEALTELAQQLESILHLSTLRLHSRMPVMIPERIDAGLESWIRASRMRIVVVVHANHPQELDDRVTAALARLAEAGAILLHQAVLLRGINDDPDVLAKLLLKLVACRTIPYYLHQLDPVPGTLHFQVPLARGRQIWRALRDRLPGYAVPRYVVEEPGAPSKIPLTAE